MTTRVFIGTTHRRLLELVATRRLDGVAVARTAAEAGEQLADADEDELAYAAMMAAADDSWAAWSPEAGARRRFVLVADLPAAPSPDGVGPVAWAAVAALHTDTEDLAGDPDDDVELAWFATQEIPDVLAALGSPPAAR